MRDDCDVDLGIHRPAPSGKEQSGHAKKTEARPGIEPGPRDHPTGCCTQHARANAHLVRHHAHTTHAHFHAYARVARALAQARARDQRPNSRFSRGIGHIASPCLEGAKAKSQPAMKTVENAGLNRRIHGRPAGFSGIHGGFSGFALESAGFTLESAIWRDSAGFTRIQRDSRGFTRIHAGFTL